MTEELKLHGAKQSQHVWGKPVPGAGKFRVCKLCGEKELRGEHQRSCDGKMHGGVLPVEHDYDPYSR